MNERRLSEILRPEPRNGGRVGSTVGATIVRRGEPGDCVYFIAAGEVEIELSAESRRLGTGEFFGKIALLTGAALTATIVATGACTLLRLRHCRFSRAHGPTARSRARYL